MGTKAPEVDVLIAGKNIETDLGGICGRIETKLDMDNESYAVVEVGGVYSIESRCLNQKISAVLLPGSKIEISMGYAGDKKKIFIGYLDQIELETGSTFGYTLRLKAYDVIHLMKENIRCRMLKQKRHSDVVTELMQAYSWLGVSASCDNTDAYDKARCWYQNESDYDFLQRELIEQCPNDREFYISLGVACYKKITAGQPAVTLEHDENLDIFHASSKYLNRTIQVYGTSPAFQVFTASETAAGSNISSSAGAGVEMIVNPDAESQDIVAGIAESRAKRLLRQSVRIEMDITGDYRLLSGTYVKADKIDPVWNGVYRIRTAVHTFDGSGYRTRIIVEGS